MCMEDYRIGRKLKTNLVPIPIAASAIDLAGRADRVGLYVYCPAADAVVVSIAAGGGSQVIWTSSPTETSKFFDLQTLGDLLPMAFHFDTGGVEVAVVLETWLDDH